MPKLFEQYLVMLPSKREIHLSRVYDQKRRSLVTVKNPT